MLDLRVPGKEAPANSVPAAAVIRRVQALIGFIGCKERVGGSSKSDVKFRSSTSELHLKLFVLRIDGENGIPSVAVKCVDMWKNTGGESGFLVYS